MSTLAKVAWSEGILLSHQHFQQQERYLQLQSHLKISNMQSYSWGVTRLAIDDSLLKLGKFSLKNIDAIFADGSVLCAPTVDCLPAVLDIPVGTSHCDICLTLPLSRSGIAEMNAMNPDEKNALRYQIEECDVDDVARLSEQKVTIGVAKLKPQLVLSTEKTANMIAIPVARIRHCDADNGVIVEEDYIASGLNVQHLAKLNSFAHECLSLLYHRKKKLSQQVSVRKGKLFSDLSDLLLLQLCNKGSAQLQAYLNQSVLHPYCLYQYFVNMLAELATFTLEQKTYEKFPAYQHDQLTETFTPLMKKLRFALSAVLEQPSVEIPVTKNGNGHFVAVIEDKSLFNGGEFILAAKADLGAEHLEKCIVSQAKIAPIDKLTEIISSQVPGIQLSALPVAPPQIPYISGMHYFTLDTQSQYWHGCKSSGGIAMQFVGELPGLEVALWAIK